MANLWDTLDEGQRTALARHAIQGSGNTPENMNRARQQLAENPNLVERLAKESGVIEDDDTMQDEEDVAESNDIERAVDASLEQSGDVQQAGTITKGQYAQGEASEDWQTQIDNAESDDELLEIVRRMKTKGISPSNEHDLQPKRVEIS